ncbi:sirohydrochlorin chelatase [Nocardioides limicola]|uniref:sirohydrochlorin chelatase n=1 Tax=Nocardioides limicola TaxID=2803368 RepID=UPI00193BFB08|nr:CbiX/SirB N-terminal domain-containing protein [Nocardioides sp. DJM-14]
MRSARLVTVAHGTRTGPGNLVAGQVTSAAGRLLGVPAQASYVELCVPTFAEVMARAEEATVVVPLLLSTGYHVRHDLPAAAARSAAPVTMCPPLGPHPLLAEVMARRLLQARANPGDPVVMVAAGSRDRAAAADLDRAARLLERRWGGPVTVATVSGAGPRLPQAIAHARAGVDTGAAERLAVVPYLSAVGHFSREAAAQASACGVSRVAGVLGPHPLLVELVVRRYLAAVAAVDAAA